ncbi:Transposase [Romboutsia ilealis]|uniref:Transposase n=4 Tax=Romboutsia ilealis TaxID=1115758 RepID=A0A1V1I0I1_9FIRM|nr:Transposase [Romboutsia ilealis]
MSRRGNCWDNAPQESFFGHFKDEVILNNCSTLEQVRNEIDDYMDYYNNDRYQWNLNKMTPVQYRNHLAF